MLHGLLIKVEIKKKSVDVRFIQSGKSYHSYVGN